jgi:hypothetical protein
LPFDKPESEKCVYPRAELVEALLQNFCQRAYRMPAPLHFTDIQIFLTTYKPNGTKNTTKQAFTAPKRENCEKSSSAKCF